MVAPKPTSVAQVDANGCTQAHSGGTSRRQRSHLSPLRWHKSTLTVTSKPTPVAQADFGRNLEPAPAAKLLVFSDFFIRFGFLESNFRFFHLKSTTRGTKSTIVVASQSPLRAASKSRFLKSHIKVRSVRQLKSTLVFKSRLKVSFARHKVDFGFQVTF
jgi:hypothetical protein